MLIILGAAMLCGSFWTWRVYRQYPLRELPELDVSQAVPAVVQEIDRARAAVYAAPRSGPAWGKLGMLLRAHEFGPAAERCLAQAERLDPREVRWPYIRGVSLTISDSTAAEACLEQAARLRPDLPISRLRLAELHLDQHRLELAEREFRAVLEREPEHPRAALGLGRLAFLKGDFPAAVKWAKAAAEKAPRNRGPRELLLQALHRQGDEQGVQQQVLLLGQMPVDDPGWEDPFVEQVMQLRRDPAWLGASARELLAEGRTAEAISLLEGLVADQPGDPQWPVQLAQTLTNLGDVSRAARVVEATLRVHPNNPDIHFQHGVVFFLRRQWQAAAESFKEAVRLRPEFADAHYNLGHALKQLHEKPGALAEFREAVRYQPALVQAHVNIADLLLDLDRRKEAEESLKAAMRLSPNDKAVRQLEEKLRKVRE